jgi:hypothetical protein
MISMGKYSSSDIFQTPAYYAIYHQKFSMYKFIYYCSFLGLVDTGNTDHSRMPRPSVSPPIPLLVSSTLLSQKVSESISRQMTCHQQYPDF